MCIDAILGCDIFEKKTFDSILIAIAIPGIFITCFNWYQERIQKFLYVWLNIEKCFLQLSAFRSTSSINMSY